jgi:hypothetical protein
MEIQKEDKCFRGKSNDPDTCDTTGKHEEQACFVETVTAFYPFQCLHHHEI